MVHLMSLTLYSKFNLCKENKYFSELGMLCNALFELACPKHLILQRLHKRFHLTLSNLESPMFYLILVFYYCHYFKSQIAVLFICEQSYCLLSNLKLIWRVFQLFQTVFAEFWDNRINNNIFERFQFKLTF